MKGIRRSTALVLLLTATTAAEAQRLPVRHYGLAEGLPHNSITSILQDRKGFLWIGTFEGLARFDGYRFEIYTTADGLGHDYISDIAEDRNGRLWVGTNGGGVAVLREDWSEEWARLATMGERGASRPRKSFTTFRVGETDHSNGINAIAFDHDNVLWCATGAGLYRAADPGSPPAVFQPVPRHAQSDVSNIFIDSAHRVWIWIRHSRLIQIAGGRETSYADQLPRSRIVELTEDQDGRLLVAGDGGAFEHAARSASETPGAGAWTALLIRSGQQAAARGVLRDSSGVLWIATADGLVRSAGGRHTTYSVVDGLPADPNRVLMKDRDDNVWIGSATSGLYRISSLVIASVTTADRRPLGGVRSVFEGAGGHFYARLSTGDVVEIVDDVALAPTTSVRPELWPGRHAFLSRTGDWWVLHADRLCRINGPRLDLARPASCIDLQTMGAGYLMRSSDTMDIPDLLEDADGRITFGTRDGLWSVTLQPGGGERLDRRLANVPPALAGVAPAFEDRDHNLWLFSADKIIRSAGKTVSVGAAEGVPASQPRSVLLDRQGRLWIGTRYNGAVMTRAPGADRLQFVSYTTKDGLSSNTVWSIAEDDQGRIYFGTGRGLDRLEPASGRIRRFTTADGLAGDLVNQCVKDRRGFIWVATPTGLSRLDPRVEGTLAAPPIVYLSRVQIAGQDLPLPETGAAHAPRLTLRPAQNSLLIQYVSPSFRGEHSLQYQYRLDGVDSDWSAPTEERAVNYARLSAGSYQFLVRAIDRDGAISVDPAVLEFEILPPFWQRAWFLALSAVSLIATGFGLHRMRLRRFLALDRLRRQIATDLHDDIGAGLAQVAILSEVARRQTTTADAGHLIEIAALARSMRDSMSDIVWAIDPRKDRVAHLVQRMRQVAQNALASDGVRVEFRGPPESALDRLTLSPDRRRHLLLILKEAVTNIARHANASTVTIEFSVKKHEAHLRIQDDGRGFDVLAVHDGHGLSNLYSRSRDLGAQISIDSAVGKGTRIDVTVSLG